MLILCLIYVVQLKKKLKNPLYYCFVDLEKAFDSVPRAVLWWALGELVVEEWAVDSVQDMYSNVCILVYENG